MTDKHDEFQSSFQKIAPANIFLNPFDYDDAEVVDLSDCTWSEDSVEENSVKYIRADLVAQSPLREAPAPQEPSPAALALAREDLGRCMRLAGMQGLVSKEEFEKLRTRIVYAIASVPKPQAEAAPALTLDLDALAMVLLDRAVEEENLSPNEDSSFWYPWSECNEACRDGWRREAQDLLTAVEAKRQANLGTPADSGKDAAK